MTVVRVGRELGWPLARDEPVVKLERLHYLFTLPGKDGAFLNYGVSFADATLLPSLDVLAKAIGAGTSHLVKGIFMCSEAYASQVQNGASLISPQSAGGASKRFGGTAGADGNSQAGPVKRGGVNKSLKTVRKLSEMTEKMSKTMLDTVISVTGSMAAPLLRSNQGKALLATAPERSFWPLSTPSENKVMDAVEAAERRSLAATSNVVSGAVSKSWSTLRSAAVRIW